MPPSQRRRLSREEERKRKNRLGALILAGLAVVAALFGLAAYITRPAPIGPDGCALDEISPVAHTIILLDETDPYTPVEVEYAKALISAEYLRLAPQQKLTVRFIDPDPALAKRTLSRCRVRLGKNVNPAFGNPQMVQAQFRRIAGDEIERFTNSLATVPAGRFSPILEAVDEAVESPDFGLNVPVRRLVVLSDMAQNSSVFSQYGGHAGSKLSQDVRNSVDRDQLKGVQVRIHYLRRPALSHLQSPTHRQFWLDWFRSNSAQPQLGWGLQLVDPPANPDAK